MGGELMTRSLDTGLAVREQPANDIAIYNGNPLSKRGGGAIVQVRSKEVMVAGKKINLDPYQLIRMIKQVTQTIGEYKGQDNPYALYVVKGMRKIRADMVSDLEHNFRIHWQVGDDGTSVFFM